MIGMSTVARTADYRERLWPSLWQLILPVVFLIPSVSLVLTPINAAIALPVALLVTALVIVIMLLGSPVVAIADGQFTAGRASIPVRQLGRTRLIGETELKRAIGVDLDARAFLMIRGTVKQAIKIENVDPHDPAPYWVVSSRRPADLDASLKAAQAAA